MNVKSSNYSALQLLVVLVLQNVNTSAAFSIISTPSRSISNHHIAGTTRFHPRTTSSIVVFSDDGEDKDIVPITEEAKTDAVGNLVENDEWEGLTMELSEIIRTAVVEDIKTNARDFLGKDEYEMGDISKEIDSRVKSEIATLRGNEEYELGDLIVVMDNYVSRIVKNQYFSYWMDFFDSYSKIGGRRTRAKAYFLPIYLFFKRQKT